MFVLFVLARQFFYLSHVRIHQGRNGKLTDVMENFGDFIAQEVLSHYAKIPFKGKPHGEEWTILAGIVQTNSG